MSSPGVAQCRVDETSHWLLRGRAVAPLVFATVIYTAFLIGMQPLYDDKRVPVINPTPMLYGVALIMTPRWHRLWVFPLVAAATFFSVWIGVGKADSYISILGVSFSRAAGILIFVLFLEMLLADQVDVRRPWHIIALAFAMFASIVARSYLLPWIVPQALQDGSSPVARFIDAFVPNTPTAFATVSIGQAAGLLGVIALVPPVLLLMTVPWKTPSLRGFLTSLLVGGLILSLVWFVFNQPSGSLLFLITVAMVVVTFTVGLVGASLCVLATGFIALLVQLNNLRLNVFSVLDNETLTVQTFLASTTLVTLLVGAVLEQRQLFQLQSEENRRAAEQANAAKSRFLAVMSHEIRSPLASLTLLTSALRKSTLDTDERMESIRIIDTIGRHVLSLLNGILNYTRFEAVGHVLEPRMTNIRRLIDNVISTLSVQAHERGIKLEAVASKAVPDLMIDPERVGQVLTNLISNGLQHARSNLAVACTYAIDRGRLRVEVIDDGAGIPDSERANIFEPYYRLEGEVRMGRVGLGLAISRESIALMGGEIGVDRGPDQKTVFWFEIPAHPFNDLEH